MTRRGSLGRSPRVGARARAWQLIRELGTFTSGDLVRAGVIQRHACYAFLRALGQAGILHQLGTCGRRGQRGSGVRWHLPTDPGPRVPLLSDTWEVVDRNRAPLPSRQQAWNSMRIFRVFSARDIVGTADIGLTTLWGMLRQFAQHGYVVRQGERGTKGLPGWGIVWRLAKNTGPQVPQITRDGRLLDPNLAGQGKEDRHDGTDPKTAAE